MEIKHTVINDTLHGGAIDYTVQRTGCFYQPVFGMMQKQKESRAQEVAEAFRIEFAEVQNGDEMP